jgi:ATP-dependent protease ClpP protease subunit
MIHDGFESLQDATPKSFEAWARESKANRETMYRIFSERSGKPERYWEKRCASDFIITAEQAVEVGLADRVAGVSEDEETENE